MTDEYKPTRKEVCKELFGGFVSSKPYAVLKDFGEMAMCSFGLTSIGPHCIPTAARIFTDSTKSDSTSLDNEPASPRAEYAGAVTGITFGITCAALQVVGYHYAVQHDHPEVLAIPIATNIISGAYELYRSAKNRLVERHGKEISDTVDNSPVIGAGK